MDKAKCQICGKEFTQITSSHLKLHNITRTEYIKMFGIKGVQNTRRFSRPKNGGERVANDYNFDKVMKCSLK
jgi:DNA invertase Pin-like site-specific DNA recombinase